MFNLEWETEDIIELEFLLHDHQLHELVEIFNRPEEEILAMSLHIRWEHKDLAENGYDKANRMRYSELFHDMQGKPWTVEDLQYLCQYHDVDGISKIALALGRTAKTVTSTLHKIRENGMYDIYRNERERQNAKH